jgi:hypothetical protein
VRAPPQSPYTQTGGLCRFASSIPPRAWCVICCTTKAETSCQCSARRSALRPALVSPHGLTVTSGLVESTRPCPHLRQSAVAIVYALGIHCWTIKDWYFRGKTNLECGFAQKTSGPASLGRGSAKLGIIIFEHRTSIPRAREATYRRGLRMITSTGPLGSKMEKLQSSSKRKGPLG